MHDNPYNDISDSAIRLEVLNPKQSYIVSAPAGSGKTDLLTKRFLRLLSVVKNPEKIIAITFTRKAASEMRQRILHALHDANTTTVISDKDEDTLSYYAHRVITTLRSQTIDLLHLEQRLRISTIDSFLVGVLQQTALAGKLFSINQNVEHLFRAAADDTLSLQCEPEWEDHFRRILQYFSNNKKKLHASIQYLLSCRDQWYSKVTRYTSSATFKKSFSDLIALELQRLKKLFPEHAKEMLRYFIQDYLSSTSHQANIVVPDVLRFDVQELDFWNLVTRLLLTKQGKWRATTKSALRHISLSKTYIQDEAVLSQLITDYQLLHKAICKVANLDKAIHEIGYIPLELTQEDDLLIESFVKVLKTGIAFLHMHFKKEAVIDHAGIMLSVLGLLHRDDSTSYDLLSKLDQQIEHMLIDEFQDVSISQYDFFLRIIEHWQGRNKTLFLVGDPMQSIYRFREADLSIFSSIFQNKFIGPVPLKAVRLQQNFRSHAAVVEWANNCFSHMFLSGNFSPNFEVGYSASHAVHTSKLPDAGVFCYTVDGDEEIDTALLQAEQICALIAHRRSKNPSEKIAILVSRRSLLNHILPALHRANIDYTGIDLSTLATRTEISDLCALTYALLSPADLLSWFTVLRAPWCGLQLNELLQIRSCLKKEACFPDLFHDTERYALLDLSIRKRLELIKEMTCALLPRVGRMQNDKLIRKAWTMLRGGGSVTNLSALQNCEQFFKLLQEVDPRDRIRFSSYLQRMASVPMAKSANPVEIMTIHKAKGLEFDTVILPECDREQHTKKTSTLLWHGFLLQEEYGFLIAMENRSHDAAHADLYTYLKQLEYRKNLEEKIRLFYVAVTRAKQRAYLFASSKQSRTSKETLFSYIAPYFKDALQIPLTDQESQNSTQEPQCMLRRFSLQWQPPLPQESIIAPQYRTDYETPLTPEFSWSSRHIRNIGIVTHRFFERIAQDGLLYWDSDRIQRSIALIEVELLGLGTTRSKLDNAVTQVCTALKNTLQDERGRWILTDHPDAKSEYAISVYQSDKLLNIVVDRTFVDNDIRYVIDYKVGRHTGGDLSHFIQTEVDRYRDKLCIYGDAIRKHTRDDKIVLALYFPLYQIWQEVQETIAH